MLTLLALTLGDHTNLGNLRVGRFWRYLFQKKEWSKRATKRTCIDLAAAQKSRYMFVVMMIFDFLFFG
jgi:hypothetical protein